MSAQSRSVSRIVPGTLIAAIAWMACYFGCRFVLDNTALPEWARVSVALVPVLPFIAVLACVISDVRGMDELHRRVHLEALAFAFPAGVTVLMVLGLLQLVLEFHPQRFNFRDAWPILCMLYFVGLAWSWRRYK